MHLITCYYVINNNHRRLLEPATVKIFMFLQRLRLTCLGAIQNAIASFTNELGTNGIPSHMVLAPEVVQRTQRNVTRVTKVASQIHEVDKYFKLPNEQQSILTSQEKL
ncbi:hypothetical protein KIN20_023883 [Parelaphostrongylus tenuis]|uniref:Uncharacterized protein n=1 Tax=Parelaphostrongylus tenuis TaxID=148309 RepID=A0AAD5NAH2_PARTN|nr:hypothetical protein KIN20_023883 [Parelaphostrongylus tenuis]